MTGLAELFGNVSPRFVTMLYRIPVLLLSFMTHELSHALAAYRCGDMTAKEQGRISFNPVRHIDPLGAVMLVVAGFGWAKPVPINPSNFKNKKAGIVVTSLAGPVSNILLAILFSAVYVVANVKSRPAVFIPATGATQVALTLLHEFYAINIALAAFNLIPIPPLDGSKVLFAMLPDKIYYGYILRYERYGMILLVVLSFSGLLFVVLGPVMDVIASFINAVIKPLTSLFLS